MRLTSPLVYVYQDVMTVPYTDIFQKFGHVQNISDSEPFVKVLTRVGSEDCNDRESEGPPLLFSGVMRQIDTNPPFACLLRELQF